MSKVVGFVIGTAMIVAGVLTGNPALIIQGGAMILTQAVVDLTMPKTPAREASEMTIALGEQPRLMLIGETFTPGSMVDAFNYGGKYGTDHEVLVIRLADHKCEGLTGFFVNDEFIPYTGDGNYPHFDGHHFSLWFRPDTTSDPLPSVVTTNGPGWTSADIGESGCDVIVDYLADKPDAKKPAWPGGRPRFGFVVKGALCYDPRKDSTIAGGSGSHRDNDPSTWEWSENAAICRYKWVRGVYANDDVSDPSQLLVGRGLTADEAPPENIIAPANVCEEAPGGSLRYDIEDAPHYGNGLGAFTRDFSRFMTLDSTGAGFYALWDTYSRTVLKTATPAGIVGFGEFVFNDAGQAYVRGFSNKVQTLTIDSAGTVTAGPAAVVTNPAAGIYYAGGLGCLTALGAQTFAQTYDGTAVTAIDVGFSVFSYLTGPDGLPWALGVSGSNIKLHQVGGGGSALTVANPAGGGATPYGLSNSDGNIILFQDNSFVVIDVAGVIQFSGSSPFGLTRQSIINHDGSDTIWIGRSQISLIDGSVIQSIPYPDWYVGAGSDMFDPINNALFGQKPADMSKVNWLFLPSARYLVAGPIYANQQYIDVEGMFAAATAGNTVTRSGSVELEPGQAKSVVATFTDDDLLVGGQVSYNQGFLSDSNQDWLNTVVANYVEPFQKWNPHDAPVMRDTADITADGKPREAHPTLRLVRYQAQALRIAEILRRLGRVWGRATVPLGPRFCELEDGDWVNWQSDRYFSGATKTFRVDAYQVDEKWQIKLTLREIAASIYADDATFPTDQARATPSPLPPAIGSPGSGDWALAAATLVSADASMPALELAGAMPADENAQSITVEYWKSDGVTDPTANPDAIPWTMAGPYSPTTTKIDVTSIEGGGTYYVAVSYVVSGEAGDRLVLGPVTVANVDVTGQVQPLIDSAVTGLSWKRAVRAKTTAALPANTYANGASGVGATLTGTANGALAAQDGVTLIVNERLLVDHEASGSHNGIYKVTQVGDATHPYILTRVTDADAGAELVNATVYVSEGTANADTQWTCTTNATITVGTTTLTFSQSGGTMAVQDEGTSQGAATIVNFTGAGVSASVSGGVATVNIPGGGGGGGGTTPTIVQSATCCVSAGAGSVTLGAAPTAGNMLIAIGTRWNFSVTLGLGWTQLFSEPGQTDDVASIYYKSVGAGESATQTFSTTNSGWAMEVFEVSGTAPSAFLSYFGDATLAAGTTAAANLGVPKTNCLGIGVFMAQLRAAPTFTITNATAGASGSDAGTTNGGPRSMRSFSNGALSTGAWQPSCTYGSSGINGYCAMVLGGV